MMKREITMSGEFSKTRHAIDANSVGGGTSGSDVKPGQLSNEQWHLALGRGIDYRQEEQSKGSKSSEDTTLTEVKPTTPQDANEGKGEADASSKPKKRLTKEQKAR